MEAEARQNSLQDFIRSLSAAADRHPALDIPVLMVFGGGYALGWLIDPLAEAGRRLRAALAARRQEAGKILGAVAACVVLVAAAVPVYQWAARRDTASPVQGTSALTAGESIPIPGAGIIIETSSHKEDTATLPAATESTVVSWSEQSLAESADDSMEQDAIPKTGQRSLVPLLLLGVAGATAAAASGPGRSRRQGEKGETP